MTDTYYYAWHACEEYIRLGDFETSDDAARAALQLADRPELPRTLYLGWGLVPDVLRLDVDRLHDFLQKQADDWHEGHTLLAEATERWVMANKETLARLEREVNQAHGTRDDQGWLAVFAVYSLEADGTVSLAGQQRGYVP